MIRNIAHGHYAVKPDNNGYVISSKHETCFYLNFGCCKWAAATCGTFARYYIILFRESINTHPASRMIETNELKIIHLKSVSHASTVRTFPTFLLAFSFDSTYMCCQPFSTIERALQIGCILIWLFTFQWSPFRNSDSSRMVRRIQGVSRLYNMNARSRSYPYATEKSCIRERKS